MEFWIHDGLNYKSSGVGKPISTDRFIEDTCRNRVGHIAFVRVLVEVDATRKLSELVAEESNVSKVLEVRVEYQ
ncbi:hypothetical protein Patl1_20660 [Pistacia atlantica]|uniref:Uncharacterized protein n=1 Tax=Pistacia atlantica TaxID=434234 RepID=A0ACC1BHQ8_9ROSI|nr:hypothetical protein Patl1_20660 [Pistacia atlantica]